MSFLLGDFLPDVETQEKTRGEYPDNRSAADYKEEKSYNERYLGMEPSSTSFDASNASWYQLAIPSNNNKDGGDDLNSILYNDDGILGGLFSTRRPKDAMAGFSSGMKTVGKGVAAGVASLVAAPVVGAAREGVPGFFKGIGAGLLAAVALPVTAVGVAGYQVARGVANTPEAITESNKGRKWDKKNRCWIEYYYSLDDEINQVLEAESTSNDKPSENNTSSPIPMSQSFVGDSKCDSTTFPSSSSAYVKVVDTTYYDLLGVSPSASADEIRRQYYRKAKQYHPDKNPDDNEAKEKFQKLGEAYQILADPERRNRYNEHGLGATQDMPVIDSSLIFTLLFGSDSLETYVGKLKMVSLVEIATGGPSNNSSIVEEILETQQHKRVIYLAIKMREKISEVINEFDPENSTAKSNSEVLEKWRETVKDEAMKLCSNSFCDAMVEAIGWSYENYGSQFLGKIDTFLGIAGRYAKFQAKTRGVASAWKMASTAIRTAMAAQNLQTAMQREEEQRQNAKDNEDTKQNIDASTKTQLQFEETLPLILETMLQITLMDIEDTIRTISKKLVKDMGVDINVRKQRAMALVELGSIFQNVANTANLGREDEKPDVRRKVEEAFIKAAQQREG
ncbi:DnaJ domain-containing protein [Cryptosporidium muris RN66]|uniref:DnaJ domain-containing protein n=1 Tax=Cryptosporidium muris (strain RN66) TaxID=441375 RepID=B6AC23_CRYMR|nr:DnaJ domain-containing protein [Cryptosporidium muris RN66]EEA05376.1 DnaJ domain-containing protein [Cryptosporidium muris RN66]|eukprot:XP_002139725.1 DnaJ domain-containing protein [Cryptosporidium muris RN66]